MEFISAEEFLKQDENIQKVFINYWQPSVGDLFTTRRIYDEIDVIIDITENDIWGMNTTFKANIYSSVDQSLKPFPLFTEGQLRKFIEDKTGLLLEIQNFSRSGYCIHLNNIEWVEKQYNNLGKDLLQAYWKVALKIAEDEVAKLC